MRKIREHNYQHQPGLQLTCFNHVTGQVCTRVTNSPTKHLLRDFFRIRGFSRRKEETVNQVSKCDLFGVRGE